MTITLQPLVQQLSCREQHWVGDGFKVSTVFSPHQMDAQTLSPFLLMDYAAPCEFSPSTLVRGVGEHPHRGFETVTLAYEGEVTHRDSCGGGGTIAAGDVQWMTAGSGVVHEEMHSARFRAEGGLFEMVQLWVNLPARLKMTAPRYQALKGDSFPTLEFGCASGRLIAGTLQGLTGPAKTHSPVTLFDMAWHDAGCVHMTLPEGATTLIFLLRGRARAQGDREAQAGDLLVFDRSVHGRIAFDAEPGTRLLVLNGEPLGEPVVAHGPFVMTTRNEILTAIYDYQQGRMGRLAPTGAESADP